MPMGSRPNPTREQHFAALQAQKAALEKQIRELEAVQALEQRRDQLEGDIASQKQVRA